MISTSLFFWESVIYVELNFTKSCASSHNPLPTKVFLWVLRAALSSASCDTARRNLLLGYII